MNSLAALLAIVLIGLTIGTQWQRLEDRYVKSNTDPFWLRALLKTGVLTVLLIIAWLVYLLLGG